MRFGYYVEKVYRTAFVIALIGAGLAQHIFLTCKEKVCGAKKPGTRR